MITIVDPGSGQYRSVRQALQRLGYESRTGTDAQSILHSDGVVLIGAGSFGDAMLTLCRAGLDDTLWEVSMRGIPLLGIGLGMQLLFTESEESGLYRGLNILAGTVSHLAPSAQQPHMGWNRLLFTQPHPLFEGIKQGYVFFLHAYHAVVDNADDLLATTACGSRITAIVNRRRVFGMQFHPAKSGDLGMALLGRFAKVCEKEQA